MPSPPPPADRGAPAAPHAKSPLRVLLRLIQPEWPEIRTLVLFAVVVGLLALVTPLTVEALVNTVAFVGLLQPIIVLAIVMMACLGLAAVILAMEAMIVELIQRRLFARVATLLSRRLPRSCRATLDGAYGPELANRFFEVPILQKVGAKLLFDGVTVALSAAVGLVVLAFYHPLLLAFGVVLLALLSVVIFVLGRGAVRSAIAESDAKYRTADWLEQIMRHPFAFQQARGRRVAAVHADTLAANWLDRRRRHYRTVFRQLIGALLLQVLMSTLLLGLGGYLVTIAQLTMGQLVASWLIVSVVLAAVAKLGAQLESVYDILASCGKLGMLLDMPVEREDGQAMGGTGPARLSLRAITHPRLALPQGTDAVDLELTAGEALAIVGPSGSGKSTLLQILHGQREPGSGRVDYEGINLRALDLDRFRDQVMLARPDDVIAGTVAQNVALGRDGLDLDRICAALQQAGLWDPVQALPQGLETPLTSFGPPLSATQSDLLVLARALATQPRLLLVDCLLDRLDGPALETALAALLGAGQDRMPWTLVVATQRRSIAARLPRVLVLGPAGERQELLRARSSTM